MNPLATHPWSRLTPRARASEHLRLFERMWRLDSIGWSTGTPARAGAFRRTAAYEEERARFEALRAGSVP